MSTFKDTSKEIIFEKILCLYFDQSYIPNLSSIPYLFSFPFSYNLFLNPLSAVNAASYGHRCSIIHQSKHRLSGPQF